jgi:hypothetical protein
MVAEGRGVATPRPLQCQECTINRAPTLVRPAANNYVVTRSRPYLETADAMSSHPYLGLTEAVRWTR